MSKMLAVKTGKKKSGFLPLQHSCYLSVKMSSRRCALFAPQRSDHHDHQQVGGQMEIGLKTGKVTCFISLSLVASQHIVLSTLAAIASLTRR